MYNYTIIHMICMYYCMYCSESFSNVELYYYTYNLYVLLYVLLHKFVVMYNYSIIHMKGGTINITNCRSHSIVEVVDWPSPWWQWLEQ